MKRRLSFALFLIILFSAVSCTGLSESETINYYVPELELSIDVPTMFYCTTRDKNERFFEQFNYADVGSIKATMEAKNSYLFGQIPGIRCELILMYASKDTIDLDKTDEGTAQILANRFMDSFKKQGAENVSGKLYLGKTKKAILIKCEFVQNGNKVEFLQYTFTNGETEMYNLRFRADNEITAEMEQGMQDAFESIKWGKVETSTVN